MKKNRLTKRIATDLTVAPDTLYLTKSGNEGKYDLFTSPIEENNINIEYRLYTEEDIDIYELIHEEIKKRITPKAKDDLRKLINELLDEHNNKLK